MVVLDNKALVFDGMFDDLDDFVVAAGKAETVEIHFAACGVVAVDGVFDFIEVEAHEHGAEAKAMIAMEMTNEDAGHARRGDIGENELPLRPLAWVKKKTFIIPAEKVGPVIAGPCRLLA